VSFRLTAATASCKWCGFEAPTIGAVTSGLCSNQARAAWAGGTPLSREQNPNYDFRLDPAGRRLRALLSILWGASGTVSINF